MNKKKQHFTIREIAKLAGVSVATVSRVINNSPYVGETTREKVLKVIQTYHYIPNPAAKALSSKSNKSLYKGCIAIIIADTAKYGFANLFFSKVFYGIMEESVEYKYNLFTRIIKTSGSDFFSEINLIMDNSDGIIAIGHGVENFVYEVIKRNPSYPLVLIESYSKVPYIKLNSILVDNFSAAYLATKYLIDCGHKKIGMIKGPDDYISALDRYKGFLEALKENGLPFYSKYIEEGNLEYIGGYEAAVRMIKRLKRKDFPTALFCVNDFTALGVKDALEKNGFSIPDDVSLVGFDNIELTQQVTPALTTMDVPKEEMGRLAVRRLNDLICSKDLATVNLKVSAKLIERKSVKILEKKIKRRKR